MAKFGIGQAVLRVEDQRFLTGQGRYVDDIVLPGMAYGVNVVSPHAHAKIKKIDTAKAKAAPGVLAVLTGAVQVDDQTRRALDASGDVQHIGAVQAPERQHTGGVDAARGCGATAVHTTAHQRGDRGRCAQKVAQSHESPWRRPIATIAGHDGHAGRIG